mgnify:CR=1 FL=1
MSGISLIFPHADNPWNNECLALKRRMLVENTRGPYQLLYVSGSTKEDVYPTWNWLAARAKYDIILWDNSDLVYAPGWDEPIQRHINEADWLCLRSVECGVIGVASSNIDRNFGRTPASFDRPAFEAFCVEDAEARTEIEPGLFGWYSPSAFRRQWFLDQGGFDCDLYPPFPFPVDIKFREKVTARGCRFAIVGSYAYHFQLARENAGERDFSPTR